MSLLGLGKFNKIGLACVYLNDDTFHNNNPIFIAFIAHIMPK